MENMCRKLAASIGKKLDYDHEKTEVIAYGLIAIAQTVNLFLMSTIFGLVFGCFIECMVIFFAVGILRKSTGGVHAQTMVGCLIMAIFVIGLLGGTARYAFNGIYNSLAERHIHYIILLIYIPIYLIAIRTVMKLAPVQSPNKPIKNPKKIKKLNRLSTITIAIYFMLSSLFFTLTPFNGRFLSISISFLFSSIWQTFTLTKSGHKFITAIDIIKPRP